MHAGVRRLLVGDFKQLLIFLVLLFILRPYHIGLDYIAIWHILFTGVLLAAIFNCHHSQKMKNAALLIGMPTFILNWWSLFTSSEILFFAGLAASLVFLIFAIFALLYRVLLWQVTADILRGTICVYFMIGFAFALIYTLMEFLYPGSFAGLREKVVGNLMDYSHAEMVYFSFITLLAIGFGDIIPTGDLGQVMVVCEGVIGQFYLAILVARMVGAYARARNRVKTTK